ncbi:transcriptional regulator with XRE-family HTH domain [Aurantimicrobium minutum]|uniref:helix-turn-helix domain-containing protein n=1 Tax=Aurantimicrobium minutum TaxID=708131 RepID=UPI002472F8E7|nr:helix-turn-helix transcriptional regulator [Aurantimicrobium minutum]MDH6277226.1 transcriptional regulator with XRE-family HTH domain [Aurantimicrobium minutum]
MASAGVREIQQRKAFGDRIRALRSEQGLSQEEFAHEIGLDRTYIGGVERGERNVSLDNIHRIASALDVSPSELFAN